MYDVASFMLGIVAGTIVTLSVGLAIELLREVKNNEGC